MDVEPSNLVPQKKTELNKPWRVTTKMAAVFQVRFDIWMNTWMI